MPYVPIPKQIPLELPDQLLYENTSGKKLESKFPQNAGSGYMLYFGQVVTPKYILQNIIGYAFKSKNRSKRQ